MSSSDKRLGKKPVGGQRTTPGVSRTTGSSTSGTTRDEMQSKISRVGDQLQRLQRNLLLSDVQDEIENIDTTLALLPAELERLRTRGYVFRSLEEAAPVAEPIPGPSTEAIAEACRRLQGPALVAQLLGDGVQEVGVLGVGVGEEVLPPRAAALEIAHRRRPIDHPTRGARRELHVSRAWAAGRAAAR